MEWIKVSEKEPDKYEEVIICTETGVVKSATYMGVSKWTTYNKVVFLDANAKSPEGSCE